MHFCATSWEAAAVLATTWLERGQALLLPEPEEDDEYEDYSFYDDDEYEGGYGAAAMEADDGAAQRNDDDDAEMGEAPFCGYVMTAMRLDLDVGADDGEPIAVVTSAVNVREGSRCVSSPPLRARKRA